MCYPLNMDDLNVYRTDIEFDWVDSNTFTLSEDGKLIEAGTCLRINDYIMFLKHFSENNLRLLKLKVNEAIDHELSKRGLNV